MDVQAQAFILTIQLQIQRSVGHLVCLKMLYKVCLKRFGKEKKSMNGPGQL